MLEKPRHLDAPFCLFTLEGALSEARLVALEALFDAEPAWVRHEDHFYECFIAEVTDALDRRWLQALARRMAEHTGLDLVDAVQVTIQRMTPGDHADPHTDRPLLGYEAARLVLQLDAQWEPVDGGLFRAFDGDAPILARAPSRNQAVGFALTSRSLHEVTPTARIRRSVVFNFWHAGNSAAVEALVRGLFVGMDFGSLPEAVWRRAEQAEVTHSEEATHRASAVSIALLAWGYSPQETAEGYTLALEAPSTPTMSPDQEIVIAVALAGWLHRLYTEDFDIERWTALRQRLLAHEPGQHPRLLAPWTAAFSGNPPAR